MTVSQRIDRVTITFKADGYTMLDLFVERIEGEGEPVVRLTDSRGNVDERGMDADLYRQRITMTVDPEEQYRLELASAKLPYAYLAGGADLMERGILPIDCTVGSRAVDNHEPPRALAHYEPPEHWMNDPNGLCRFQGRYHLYYQFNPYGWHWGNMHWGHAVSTDLVHWTHLPVFLEPQRELHENRMLSGGAFSGSAIPVDAEGRPCPGDQASAIRFYLTRHRAVLGDELSTTEYQTTLVSEDSLTPGPETTVIEYPDPSVGYDFRDPKVETGFDGGAMIVTGTFMPSDQATAAEPNDADPPAGVSARFDGGWFTTNAHGDPDVEQADMTHIPAVLAFRNNTPDLRNDAWEYAGPLLVDRGYQIGRTYECPDAFPLDGSDVVIGAIMHVRTTTGAFQPIRWYVGALKDDGFRVGESGWVDFGNCYYAVQSFRDDRDRRIAIGWLSDWRGEARRQAPGRANGAMSLPRELHVRDGRLYSRPVAEVYDALGEVIDGEMGVWTVPDNAYYADISVTGDVDATLCDTGVGSWRLEVRDGVVRCVSRGMGSDDVTCEARVDEVRRVEVFYDRGIIEVFVNDGEAAGAMLGFDPRGVGELTVVGDCTCEVRGLIK